MKAKIAISIDQPLLELVDSKIDGRIIRSRSQAMEYFLSKGLRDESITTAIILLKGEHQSISLQEHNGATLLNKQLQFFHNNGFQRVMIVTQHTKLSTKLLDAVTNSPVATNIVETTEKGNAKALQSVVSSISGNIAVMSGDTLNQFDLSTMIKKHLSMDKLVTMGLMTREHTQSYGTAILDGDFIIDFREKPKQSSTQIVNAGIYLFKKEVFELFGSISSLEKDLFPQLARMKQLVGFFTYGEYEHFG